LCERDCCPGARNLTGAQIFWSQMNNTTLSHVEINIDPRNLAFYRDLFGFLGWSTLCDDGHVFGTGDANQTSLWFDGPAKPTVNDYDGPGMNHLGISVKHLADVDEALRYIQGRGIPALFETPRHRPEFASPGRMYYQIMFESPDRVLFEIVYAGPKDA
jgi:catechol 2,3-dioxygenase-like lactoylglutathione lyase family enzyme